MGQQARWKQALAEMAFAPDLVMVSTMPEVVKGIATVLEVVMAPL